MSKFKQASELCEDFNELGVMRTLASYYYNRALTLEKNILINSKQETSESLKPAKKETPAFDEPLLLNGTGVEKAVFEAVLGMAVEIGREGREGHSIGTAFILGDSANIMAKSRQLILNPFAGHSRETRMVSDPEIRDNVKEFAQLDGVFVVSAEGVVEAAGRYITVDTGMVSIPRGLGTRHSSVAAITSMTKALGIVVSQSGGVIRIFKGGKIAVTIRP
ncbi:DisA bacterial checkpoint controller nucleotide-binding protein [uncultured archaeon]|nr:DisA bacterial checkpoint controller nucleotide-binding protein [uncultured archaeon]